MIEADDIRVMSEMLAADPGSLVFLQLGEALRRKAQLDLAWRVATRGIERHPQRADAHDLVARVAADRSDFGRARTAWEMALQLAPGHPAAQKGLGFLLFAQGELAAAEKFLSAAATADPNDASIAAALAKIRESSQEVFASERPTVEIQAVGAAPKRASIATPRSTRATPRASRVTQALAAPIPFAPNPVDARHLFRESLPDAMHAALLLDDQGLVVAGQYRGPDGRDLSADVGAQLSGVSDEASRAMKHLGLGVWRHISFEAQSASVAMAPSGTGVLLVAAPRNVPLGFVRRVLEKCVERAKRWLESGA
jgi:predicted regulator of Ras-like GTPase activity (Roadblock/LC7/MglB family)/predicted Zn-dependent protease